ncbi:MAG: hypothetical protein ACJAY6_002250 [Yoonia sp.]|jgi:hypothetical protein
MFLAVAMVSAGKVQLCDCSLSETALPLALGHLIKKKRYWAICVKDYHKPTQSIGPLMQKLAPQPRIQLRV